jgi:hypothetical protein
LTELAQRSSFSRVAALVVTAALVATASACGSRPADPLKGPGAPSAEAMHLMPSRPTADFTVPFSELAGTKHPVQLISVIVLPYKSYAVPPVLHTRYVSNAGIDISYDWPAHSPEGQMTSLQNAKVHVGLQGIVLNVGTPQPGVVYALKGIRLTYRYRGTTFTKAIPEGMVTCRIAKGSAPCRPAVDNVMNELTD